MKSHKKTLLITAILLGIIAFAIAKSADFIESSITAAMADAGIAQPSLSLMYIGTSSAEIEKITAGGGALAIEKITASYSPASLINGAASNINIDGLNAEISDNDGKLAISGIAIKSGSSSGTMLMPKDINALPFHSLIIKNSIIKIKTGIIEAEIKADADLQTSPAAKFHYETSSLNISSPNIKAAIGKIFFDATANNDATGWTGRWQINGIALTGAPADIPTLKANGVAEITAATAMINGSIVDDSGKYHASFKLNYAMQNENNRSIIISDITIPWNNGRIGIKTLEIGLAHKADINFTLTVEHVSIEELMHSLTGEHASGTGIVSGSVPVTLKADGSIIMREGKLQAEQPGIISIRPEAIPGDNSQMSLARDVLQNLHYNTLSMAIDSKDDNKLSILLAVEGKNPQISGSRPVRLNVRLNGDMLGLLRQNIMAITNPRGLLEKSGNE